MTDLENPVGRSRLGQEDQELCFGHVKFEMAFEHSGGMSSQ